MCESCPSTIQTPIVSENGDFQRVKNCVKIGIESEIGPTHFYELVMDRDQNLRELSVNVIS